MNLLLRTMTEPEPIEDYYATMPIDTDSDTPLFNTRGLFRQSS